MITRNLNTILLFSVICLLFVSCENSETIRNFDMDEVVFKGDSAFTLEGQLLTGAIIDNFIATDDVWTEENYVNGVRHGINRVYYPNGNIQREIDYKNGLRDGFHITYFEEGRMARIKAYRNGIAHGFEIHYYLSGKMWRFMEFDNGKRVYLTRKSKYMD